MKGKLNLSRYNTFGLRQEWMELFFTKNFDAIYNSSLGPRQKDALFYYVMDLELICEKKKLTNCFNRMLAIYKSESITSSFLWSILWVNLTYNSLLFTWWTEKPVKKYVREEIITALSNTYGTMNRSINNGYQSLIGTLERTPFGNELRQGIVQKEGNRRVVSKAGNPDLSPFAILYALFKRAERTLESQVDLYALAADPLSPQRIFTLDAAKVEDALRSLWLPEFFQLDPGQSHVRVRLMPGETSLDVLDAYLERTKG